MQARVAEMTGQDERRPRRCALAALALLAGLLAGCQSIGQSTGSGSIVVAGGGTPPDAAANVREHPRIVAAFGGVYRDTDVERTVAAIVGRLVAASDKPDQGYQITILNAPAVNAFALPGGYLYVTRGLLALANDSAEVAAVLAHEMAHVLADHASQRRERAKTAVIVSRVVTDVLDDNAGQLSLASGERSLATFSRQQELEADAIGVRVAAKAGYDPFAAARFLKRMGAYAEYRSKLGSLQDSRPDFLASHPSTPERIAAAETAARQLGAPGNGETGREAYLGSIDGIVFGDDTGQGYVRGRNYFHSRLGIGFSVPEGFVIDNTTEAVLATGVDQTALRFDGVNLSSEVKLEDYLASGWINGLDRDTISTLTINGMEAASAMARAKGWTFRITVIRASADATYRFIFASERPGVEFERNAEIISASFRRLSAPEIASLKPLRVNIVTIKPGDTATALARRMRGVEESLGLFLTLNGLDDRQTLRAGDQVKIVID